jgi:hypothetical protein
MFATRFFNRLAVVALAAGAISGCAAMTVRSYTEPAAQFPRYHTFAWAPAEQLATGDPRLDNNPFFQQRLRAKVEDRLAVLGFVKSETPDLLVHYHANVSQRIDVNGADREYGYCEQSACRPYIVEAGTLAIDLVDARTRTVVWRGWAEGTVDGMIDDQRWLEESVDNAVTQILDRLPRQ